MPPFLQNLGKKFLDFFKKKIKKKFDPIKSKEIFFLDFAKRRA